MNAGAVVAFGLDMQERRATLATLMRPEAGFVELPDGVWLWRCVQQPLTSAVQAPAGTAVVLAAIFGLPFVRLRAALPELLFAGTVGQALGRRAGLSVHGLQDARDENVAAMTQLLAGLAFCGVVRSRIPATDPFGGDDGRGVRVGVAATAGKNQRGAPTATGAGADRLPESKDGHLCKPPAWSTGAAMDEGPYAGEGENDMDGAPDAFAEAMVGTALVLAFMANAKTLSVVQLALRVAAARAHFQGAVLAGVDHDFDALHSAFLRMLAPRNLSSRDSWLEKSRLWRFILLQRSDGGWDTSQSLAFALQAHDGGRPPPRPPQSKLRRMLGALLGDDELDDAFDDAIDEAVTSSDEEDAAVAGADGTAAAAATGAARHHRITDCPLTFSRAAIKRRLPPALAALNAEYEQQQAEAARVEAARVEADAARARQLELLQRELEAAHPASALRVASSTRLAAGVTAEASYSQQADRAPAALALLPMVDSAIAALQRELAMLRQLLLMSEPPADDAPAHIEAEQVRALERSTSRRLHRLITMRVTFPPLAASAAEEAPGGAPHPPSVDSSASALAAPRRRARQRTRLPVERVWATVLALQVLEELDSCWLVDDDADVVSTIVDAGRAFLETQGRADRRLRKLLRCGGALEVASDRARKDWKSIQAHHVAELRDADVINRFTALTHIQRASARVVRSIMTDHETFATFLDTDGYIMRWQRLMILLTLVLSTLLVSIWCAPACCCLLLSVRLPDACCNPARFYYSRGASCCAELRAMLSCAPTGGCRGTLGDCADLQAQFADVQGPYYFSNAPGEPPTAHMYLDDWVCHAFPDDAYVTDQIFVGLISVAVALPVDLILARLFEIANEDEVPHNWVDAPAGRWKLLLGKDAHQGWHLADAARPVSELVLYLVREGDNALGAALFLLGSALRRLRRRLCGGGGSEPAEAASNALAATSDASSAGGAARTEALQKRLAASAGLLGVYTCWVIFSWVIFTYGILVYRTLGDSAQQEFAKTWGVGYALNNATEWQDVAKTAVQAALVLVVLDLLRITRNLNWFEEHGARKSRACACAWAARLTRLFGRSGLCVDAGGAVQWRRTLLVVANAHARQAAVAADGGLSATLDRQNANTAPHICMSRKKGCVLARNFLLRAACATDRCAFASSPVCVLLFIFSSRSQRGPYARWCRICAGML